MSIAVKLGVLLVVNIAAVLGMIFREIQTGSTFARALNISWNRIFLNRQPRNSDEGGHGDGWYPVLHRTWWMTLFFILFLWLVRREALFGYVAVMMIGLHGWWYGLARQGETDSSGRILNLDSQWGIIFRQIDENSAFRERSLAELDLRKKNLLVLAIERGEQTVAFPKGLETLAVGDKLVIFGELHSYRTLFETP